MGVCYALASPSTGEETGQPMGMPAMYTIALATTLAVNSADSSPLEMVCENSRREYVVRFDFTGPWISADDTNYRVLAVEDTADRFVVVGLTVNDGPTFRAHFRPYRKMEYFRDNDLLQTDGCR